MTRTTNVGGPTFTGNTGAAGEGGGTLGEGFYYLSRDGLGAFNGGWESGGSGQTAPRGGLLPDCQ